MRYPIWTRLLPGLVLVLVSFPALAAKDHDDAAKEVTAAVKTLDNFKADPDMSWFREHSKEAKGLLICPKVVKAGFIFGGSGGRCTMVVKGDRGWNGPAFYSTGTASAGFQAGVQDSEIVSLLMTQKVIDALMTSEFKLSGNASVAAGPVGKGASGTPKADIIYYSRAKGLYGGVDISGAVIKPSEDYNKAYYGKAVTPIDIIVKGTAHSAEASPLIATLNSLYGSK